MNMKLDPNTFNNLTKDPKVQYLINNPDAMREAIANNPQLKEMIRRDPTIQDALLDPEKMKELLMPESIAEANQELIQGMLDKQKEAAKKQGLDENAVAPDPQYQIRKKKKKPVKKVESSDEEEG